MLEAISSVALLLTVSIAAQPVHPTGIMAAIKDGKKDAVKQFLAAGADPNARTAGGCTPVLLATQFYHPEILELILDHGGDPNVRGQGLCNDGRTPLMMASYSCQPAAVFALLKHHADVSSATKSGQTALDAAKMRNCGEAIGLINRSGTSSLDEWRKVQQNGEHLLTDPKLREIDGKAIGSPRGLHSVPSLPEPLMAKVAELVNATAFPNGARRREDFWRGSAGGKAVLWIVAETLNTFDKRTPASPYFGCGVVLIGDDLGRVSIVSQNKCRLLNEPEGAPGPTVEVAGTMPLGDESRAALFRWYEDQAGGFWVYARGPHGWERIAKSTNWSD